MILLFRLTTFGCSKLYLLLAILGYFILGYFHNSKLFLGIVGYFTLSYFLQF
jgi:hypothetical protein